VLDAPRTESNDTDLYVGQICISWPFRPDFFGEEEPIEFPATNEERLHLTRRFAQTWAEPFRSLILDLADDTEVKTLDLADWPPPKSLRGSGPVVLMGDSMHQMAMCKFFFFFLFFFLNTYCPVPCTHPRRPSRFFVCRLKRAGPTPPRTVQGRSAVVSRRNAEPTAKEKFRTDRGEGANHAIVDVLDFADVVGPSLSEQAATGNGPVGVGGLRGALDRYEDVVVKRARAGVLASRKASMDAHRWESIDENSPLLSRREMHLDFDEEVVGW
jgi:hypothetical protein